MKVFVYYNLHKKCWSVRDKKSNLVILHTDYVLLDGVKFKVSEAGRQRVLKEKQKNVHAGVEGVLVDFGNDIKTNLNKAVSYNPYKGPNFYLIDSEKPIFQAKQAMLRNKKVFI